MTISGTYDYTVSGLNIMTAALEDIQVVQSGETIANADQTTALLALNLLTKEWMGKPGFAPGMKRWTRKYGYLFLRKSKSVYNIQAIGTGGDYCAINTYNQATLSANAALGASTITVGTVTSAPTNVAVGVPALTDYIGIQLDSGDFQWTTVSVVSGAPTYGITATLTGAAAKGNQVFTFPVANQVNVPLDVLTLVRRDVNGIDYPTDRYIEIVEYEAETNKNITTTPVRWFYEKKLTNGLLYLNGFPAIVTDVLRMVLLYPIDDETTTSNTMAFPQQWFSALEWGLAKKCAPKFGKSWTQTMQDNLDEAMMSASAVDPEVVAQYFQPGLDGGDFMGRR